MEFKQAFDLCCYSLEKRFKHTCVGLCFCSVVVFFVCLLELEYTVNTLLNCYIEFCIINTILKYSP